jgi:histidinol dehydrogenase
MLSFAVFIFNSILTFYCKRKEKSSNTTSTTTTATTMDETNNRVVHDLRKFSPRGLSEQQIKKMDDRLIMALATKLEKCLEQIAESDEKQLQHDLEQQEESHKKQLQHDVELEKQKNLVKHWKYSCIPFVLLVCLLFARHLFEVTNK